MGVEAAYAFLSFPRGSPFGPADAGRAPRARRPASSADRRRAVPRGRAREAAGDRQAESQAQTPVDRRGADRDRTHRVPVADQLHGLWRSITTRPVPVAGPRPDGGLPLRLNSPTRNRRQGQSGRASLVSWTKSAALMCLTARVRLMALGGVAGPLVFVGTWAVAGAAIDGFSPVDNTISDLAATGASTHLAMTAGFVVFGLGLIAFGLASRIALDRRAGPRPSRPGLAPSAWPRHRWADGRVTPCTRPLPSSATSRSSRSRCSRRRRSLIAGDADRWSRHG